MAFAKFGTPSISVVFCPIRLLIGLRGEERETDLLDRHIQLIICLLKRNFQFLLFMEGRQSNCYWPQQTAIGLSEAFPSRIYHQESQQVGRNPMLLNSKQIPDNHIKTIIKTSPLPTKPSLYL